MPTHAANFELFQYTVFVGGEEFVGSVMNIQFSHAIHSFSASTSEGIVGHLNNALVCFRTDQLVESIVLVHCSAVMNEVSS